jgi:mannose-6-phosphate isomerase-like protein (cupin superfamily)
MVKVTVVNLKEQKNWNHWIFGTPPAIAEGSNCHSNQLQISHVKNPSDELKKEKKHAHRVPIEEYYLVLMGQLTVEVNDKKVKLEAKELLAVPPDVFHKVCDFSSDVEFLAIRSPVSSNETKVFPKES